MTNFKRKPHFIIIISCIVLIIIALVFRYYIPLLSSTEDSVFHNNTATTASYSNSNGTNLTSSSSENKTVKIKAEVWVDNWFSFYLGDKFIKEDSVPITTERSFNSETFTFDATYPLDLNFIVKDYKENDTGLEYIGKTTQQIGDGGFIAQFKNADTGELIAVTNSDWSEFTTQTAPLDTACAKVSNPVAGVAPCTFTSLEEPINWKSADFDFSSWNKAKLYTSAEVGPKDGYTTITWNSNAKFIWGENLKQSNTVLMHLRIVK